MCVSLDFKLLLLRLLLINIYIHENNVDWLHFSRFTMLIYIDLMNFLRQKIVLEHGKTLYPLR